MTVIPVPTSIAPWLSVRNGARALEFYKSAFGATEVFRMEEGGSVVARLSVEGGRVLGGRRVSRTQELQSRDSGRRFSAHYIDRG